MHSYGKASVVVALALVAAACSGASRDTGDEQPGTAQRLGGGVLKGAEWASCTAIADTSTTDPFFQTPTVSCSATAIDPSYPMHLKSLIVEIYRASDRRFYGT